MATLMQERIIAALAELHREDTSGDSVPCFTVAEISDAALRISPAQARGVLERLAAKDEIVRVGRYDSCRDAVCFRLRSVHEGSLADASGRTTAASVRAAFDRAADKARSSNSNFRRGSAVYVCTSCGMRTRETGSGESDVELCVGCYDDAGLENEHSDGHHEDNPHPDCGACQADNSTSKLARVDTSAEAVARRTDAVLDRCRDKSHEWETLFATLQLGNGWAPGEALALYELIDLQRIATRLDTLRKEMLRSLDDALPEVK